MKKVEIKYVYTTPADDIRIGSLHPSGDKVWQGSVMAVDSPRMKRQTEDFANLMEEELDLYEGVNLEGMLRKTLIKAQIMSKFMRNMDPPKDDIIDDVHESDPTDTVVGEAFTEKD